MGRKHRKHFRVVIAEKHRSVSKKVQDILGWYNPASKEHSFDQAKITKYLSYGVAMSDTVRSLFKKYDVNTDSLQSKVEEKPSKIKEDVIKKVEKTVKKTPAKKS